MKKELDKTYSPKEFEERLYKYWEESGFFKAERDSQKKPYTIVMPPPNITGQLHMGHALDCTLQDILIRWEDLQPLCQTRPRESGSGSGSHHRPPYRPSSGWRSGARRQLHRRSALCIHSASALMRLSLQCTDQ